MCFGTATVEDRELRHVNVEPAFVQPTVDEEIQIELPEGYRDFPAGDWQAEQVHPRFGAGLAMLQEITARPQDASLTRVCSVILCNMKLR